MRLIKFRVWDDENNVMVNWSDTFFGDTSPVTRYSGDFSYITMPLMQYTGLKDKNDNEIYEGDIVKDAGDVYGEVEWNEENAGYYVKLRVPEVKDNMKHWVNLHYPTVLSPISSTLKNFYVVGNIYENPELIEGN